MNTQNPAFLSESRLVPPLDFALVNTGVDKMIHSDVVNISDMTSHVQSTDPVAIHEPPRKKRKGVRFADEVL